MSAKIKCICGLTAIFALMFSAQQTHADQFMTKSKILNQAGIKIYVGENQKDAIVFHTDDIGTIKDSALYVLTSAGARSLKGKLSTMALLGECGEEIRGIGFKKSGYDGFLVATGNQIDKFLKFYPAKIKTPPSYKACLRENPKEKVNVAEYTSAGLNGSIQQIRWKRNFTKAEIERECRFCQVEYEERSQCKL